MEENRYTPFPNERGFGLRIETAAGDTVEYPCISFERERVQTLIGRMSAAMLAPVHFNDVVRDFITEQYLELLALNRLADRSAAG